MGSELSVAFVAVLAVASCAVVPASASATTWRSPIDLPARMPETYPGPIVATAAGDAIAVSWAGGSFPKMLRVDSIVRGRAGTPALMPGWELIDSTPARDGMLLLAHKAREPATGSGPQRLALFHVAFGSRRPLVRSRWSAPRATALGALAASAREATVAWVSALGTLYETRIDERWRARRARSIAPPRFDERRDPWKGVDLAAVGRRGMILAATTLRWRQPRRDGFLLLAEARAGREFIVRQRVRGLTGRPELLLGPTGRTALLVRDDGGISGGDCGGSGYPRRLWATVSEPEFTRFRAPRQLLSTPEVCYVPGEALTAGPRGRFAVAWGLGRISDSGGSSVWTATSAPGSGFGRSERVARDLLFTGTAYGADGALAITGHRGNGYGPLVHFAQRRPPGGSWGALRPVGSAGAVARILGAQALHPAAFYGGSGGLQVQLGKE